MLHIHRAERADGLVLALRDILAEPPGDPFATEIVSVPTRGMERWLTQRLSDGLGICANVGFPPPRVLVGDAIAAVSGVDPETDPWLPERLVWPLLDVVTGALEESWAGDLATHLGGADDPVRRARRFATVRHLAGLFDRYGTYRPELLLGWADGEDDDDWQAELWRRLRARIGVPSPAERLADGLRAAARRARPGRAPAAGRAVRPDAPARGRPRGPARARRGARRPPVRPAPVARAVGRDRRRRAGRPPRRRPARRRCRATGCSARGGTTRASCSSSSRAPGPPTTTIRSRTRRARCWPGSRPTSAPTARRPATSCSTRATAASRSTPATAARARSRRCATRSCTGSPRTRRSSRAT